MTHLWTLGSKMSKLKVVDFVNTFTLKFVILSTLM